MNSRVCPFGHRAWLSLEFHKQAGGLKYDFKAVDLADKPAWFTDIYRSAIGADVSSTGKVPVIQDGDTILTESAIIAKYIDEKYSAASGSSLSSADALENAQVQLFVEATAGTLIKAFYGLLRNQDAEKSSELAAGVTAAITNIGQHLLTHDGNRTEGVTGDLFLGANLGFAEILVWPWIRRINALTVHRGYTIPEAGDDAALARFHAWKTAVEAHPAVQGTFQEGDEQYYADVYTVYANPKKE